MTEKQATRRYLSALIPAMIVFITGSIGLSWLENNSDLRGITLVAIAIIPIVAILSMFLIHWRFMNEIDEYLRQIQVKAILFAAAIVMAVASAWGYLESYVDAPTLPIFWLNPIFWIAYGVGAILFSRRDLGSLR